MRFSYTCLLVCIILLNFLPCFSFLFFYIFYKQLLNSLAFFLSQSKNIAKKLSTLVFVKLGILCVFELFFDLGFCCFCYFVNRTFLLLIRLNFCCAHFSCTLLYICFNFSKNYCFDFWVFSLLFTFYTITFSISLLL